jgi:molybdenum cofactor cytidylyltransferase
MRPVTGILLAAGASRRFGANKLLAPLADGTPLAVAAARHLRAATPAALAVVRPGEESLTSLLAAEGLRIVEALDCEQGMGRSLAAGVEAAADAAGWLIALADMPYIRVSTIARLVAALAEGQPLAAPYHHGGRGHPVAFSARYGDALRTLRGDRGAAAVLAGDAHWIARIEVGDPGILRDVDLPADLEAAATR